ncbi:MAG TPA: class I SAM-dependent methyltransferase [Burkholderiales bacterium]|nr:class I SAM-dependent methyltransferase [Burkholderiales bacterium]
MKSFHTRASRAAGLLAAFLLVFGVQALAQQKYTPQRGQAGKDVIWIPTPQDVVDRMLTMAQVTPRDFVVDLGAGDGRIAIAAAKKFGARAMGIEYNPDMARHANENAAAAGVAGEGAGKAFIRQGDIFATDFSEATVLTMYLLPGLNLKLRPTILSMRPGTRVVSHAFTMDDWEPDEVSSSDGRHAYFWIVPANVQGSWNFEAHGLKSVLNFEQRFQKIAGTIALGELRAGLRAPRLRGFHIAFAYVDEKGMRREFTGTVSGGKMEGSFRDDTGATGRWTAVKR